MWRVRVRRGIRKGLTYWDASNPELHGLREVITEPNGPREFTFARPGIYTLPADQLANGDIDIYHYVIDHEVAGCLLAVRNLLDIEKGTIDGALEQWRKPTWEHLKAQELM